MYFIEGPIIVQNTQKYFQDICEHSLKIIHYLQSVCIFSHNTHLYVCVYYTCIYVIHIYKMHDIWTFNAGKVHKSELF